MFSSKICCIGLTVGASVNVRRSGAAEKTPALVTELRSLGTFATWQAERAVGDHDRNTLRLRLDLPGDSTWVVSAQCPKARKRSRPCLLTEGLAVVLLPSTHPVCYPLMEVERARNSLYPGTPHIVPDDVPHSCESDRDAFVF